MLGLRSHQHERNAFFSRDYRQRIGLSNVNLRAEERPLTVRDAAQLSRASARRQCIFGLSESRFPISA